MYHPSVCFSVFSTFWMAVSSSSVCYFTECFPFFLYLSPIVFELVPLFGCCFWFVVSFILVVVCLCCFLFVSCFRCLSLLFWSKKKSFANRSSLFSCLLCSKTMTSNYWFFFLFLFSIINFSFFSSPVFFFFKCFSPKRKQKIGKKRFFLLLLFWKFPQEMFLPLSTWLNCLVKKRFLPSAIFFFHSFFFHFFFENEGSCCFLLSFCLTLIFFFFLLLLFIERKILLLISSVFLSSLHFFICSSPFFFLFHFVLFVFLSFLLFLFFEHMFFLFHVPSGSNCFVSSLSFLFFLSPFASPISCFSTLSNQKTFVLKCPLGFLFDSFCWLLFSPTNKLIFENVLFWIFNCVSNLFCIQVLYLLFLTPFF